MAYRLGEVVCYGELWNTNHYSTHGFLALRGADPEEQQVIRFELTGNPGKDMLGKHVRFAVDEDEAERKFFEPGAHQGFQMRQIGPTGAMTAQGWVRTLPCSVEEFVRHCKLGERPPTVWKRHLYLEWYYCLECA